MTEPHVCDTKHIYLYLDNALQFSYRRIKETEDFFIAEVNNRANMRKILIC